MGKTYKVIVCGKKSIGKTTLIESLIYNRDIETYYPTIEDIYLGSWEKDKNQQRERFRFYDTKGLTNASDGETIGLYRHLLSSVDAAMLVFSSNDSDSIDCVERIKSEIEKSKDKKEICHFVAINFGTLDTTDNDFIQSRLKIPVYSVYKENKREMICQVFDELAKNVTQVVNKSSIKKILK